MPAPDIKAYVQRLRDAAKASGNDQLSKAGGSLSKTAHLALDAWDPAQIAREASQGEDPDFAYIRKLGPKPDFTREQLKEAQGGTLSNFLAAVGEGVDPTGYYAPLYDPEFEDGYGRMGANLLGAVGSGFALGPLGKIKYLPKVAKAALASKWLQTGLNALQAQSGVTSEEQQYGYEPMSKGGKLGLMLAGGTAQGLREGSQLIPKMLGKVGEVGLGTVASGVDTASQILPSHSLEARYPKLSPPMRYLEMIKDVQASPDMSSGDKNLATGMSVGIPAAAMLLPGGIHALNSFRSKVAPQADVQLPPSGAAAAAPVKPSPVERPDLPITGDFLPTSDIAKGVAKSKDLFDVMRDMREKVNADRSSLPAPEINTVMPDGSRVPLVGYRGRDRVITGNGDTHEATAFIRNQPQVMRIPLGGNTHDVTIDPGFMPGHNPSTLQPGIFAHRETKQPFMVVGHDPTNGNLLVFDPKTGKRFEGPPEAFPGSELVGKMPEAGAAESDRAAMIAKGKWDEAKRLERAGLPTQPHKATTFEDLDRQYEEIKQRMGWLKPMPSHNKFGE